MEYAVQTEGISKVYGSRKILNNISVNVPRGSIYGIVGMNGSGKTTFMRVLTGLANPTHGSYKLFGSDDLTRGHKRTGILIENPAIYKHLTGRENIKYFCKLYGIPDRQIIYKVLGMVGLTDDMNKKAGKYSLGMKQRLSIAIALLGNPDMLILDEPINGLDPKGVFEIRALLTKLNEEYGITILISSHIISELYKLATDYLIIDKGIVVEEVNKDDLEAKIHKCIKMTVDKDDLARAINILEIKLGVKDFEVLHDNVIRIFKNDDISKINITLAKEDIRITSLVHSGEDLEEYFISKVAGKKE